MRRRDSAQYWQKIQCAHADHASSAHGGIFELWGTRRSETADRAETIFLTELVIGIASAQLCVIVSCRSCQAGGQMDPAMLLRLLAVPCSSLSLSRATNVLEHCLSHADHCGER